MLWKDVLDDNIKLSAELSIHEEELKIQNEELNQIKFELESTKARYFEFLSLAPVGYIILNKDLIIKEANLATSELLGCEKERLIGRGLSTFFLSEDHASLYLHYRRLAQPKTITNGHLRSEGKMAKMFISSSKQSRRV